MAHLGSRQLCWNQFLSQYVPCTSQESEEQQEDQTTAGYGRQQQVSTSIGLDSATTETINGSGDTLSLLVVSTVYPSDSASITSYSATSASLTQSSHMVPTSSMTTIPTSSPASSPVSSPTSSPTNNAANSSETNSIMHMEHHHDNGLSKGELAAAIVVPIVVVLLAILVFILFYRRRKRTRGERAGSGASAFLPTGIVPTSIKEKWVTMRSSNESSEPQTEMVQPVVTNTQNNAYNTGLDTSSHGSGERSPPGRMSEGGTTFMEAPPPYHVNGTHAPTLPAVQQTSPLDLPHDLPRSPGGNMAPSNDRDAAALLAMPLDPPQPSSRSARSITSTLYSDTASVHSARAARMSVGGPSVIQAHANASTRSVSEDDAGDPFGTPVTSRSQDYISSHGR